MKKKIIVSIAAVFIFVIVGVIYFQNRVVSTITLDINPSIRLGLDKNEKVRSIYALNDSAKEVISNDIKGKSLDKAFEILATNLMDKGYVGEDHNLGIILHVNGRTISENVSKQIEFEFGRKDIHAEIVMIEKVTKEDEKLAKKYKVSPAKVAYIKTITEENNTIPFESLIDKSVNELEITKETGKYCDEGYTLDGDWCLKEKEQLAASNGFVCPNGYLDYNGKCYEETPYIDGSNYVCQDDFTLKDGKCYRKDTRDAQPNCEKGVYHGDDGGCYEQVYIGDAYEYCRDPGRTLYDHKCLATKPTINGGCLNGDMLYQNKCVNTRDDYYLSEWMCPNGQTNSNPNGELLFADNKCYEDKKVGSAVYSCDNDFQLDGKTCTKEETTSLQKERICPDGFTMIERDRCINVNETVEKMDGLVCEGENVRLKGNTCIVYEFIEAKIG